VLYMFLIMLIIVIYYYHIVVLSTKNVLADGPDGPRWWCGRSAHAQSQLGFLVSRGICYLKPRD
jgi:hypothetical protein